MTFKSKLMIAFSLAAGMLGFCGKAQAQTANINTAAYFNIHYQENRLGAGIFTGPVYNFNSGKTNFEFNAYAGLTVTGVKSPVKVKIGATAGLSTVPKGFVEYASPTFRLSPQIKSEKGKLLNNFYLVGTLSAKKTPTLYLGFSLPIGSRKNTSTGVLLEMQRYP